MTASPAATADPARIPAADIKAVTPEAQTTPQAWRWWLPVALAALALALLFADPFAGDWDALDYTVQALKFEPSSMLFGRMLFIFTNALAYRLAHALFGLQPEHAYLLFKYMVVVESALAVVAAWVLARELSGSVRTATVSALLLALSPFYVIYSGQAMTEIPSLLLLAVALVVHIRGLRRGSVPLVLLGAALLGVGNNVREVAALYGVWLILGPLAFRWKVDARNLAITAAACVVFFLCALGPWCYYYFADVGGYQKAWHGWVESMRSEESAHPVSVRNFVPLFFFFFIAAPLVLVALPAAAYREWRERGWSPLLVLGAVGLFANLMLITHYSTVINGRYLLTGLLGLIPLAADYLVRAEERRTCDARRGFALAAGGVALTAVIIGAAFYPFAWPTIKSHGLTKEYRERLRLLPDDAVVMAGGQTVSVTFYRGVGAGRWDVIGTGGGWPGERLTEVIDEHLRQGRRVFLDADPRWWSTTGWQLEETRAVAALEGRYRFRRVADHLYEIRPPEDEGAQDRPNLQRLLDRPPTKIQRLKSKL